MSNEEIHSTLLRKYSSFNSNVKVQFTTPRTLEQWKQNLHIDSALDRFSFIPEDYQYKVLNMYQLHQECIHAINKVESEEKVHYDYVINNRDDSYFLQPFNLTFLLGLANLSNCHLLARDCLGFGGFSMRSQIMPADFGKLLMSSRLSFYTSMYRKNITFGTPEQMELAMVDEYGLKTCTVPPEYYAAAAARHIGDGEICFHHMEWEQHGVECYPKRFRWFIRSKRC
eukprot:gene40238-53175_t